MDIQFLSQREKAAILIITLGENYAAQLYRHLDEEEIGTLTLTIASVSKVDAETREAVLSEFFESCVAQKFVSEGGLDYARNVLDKAMGKEKADEILEKLSSTFQMKPFEFVRRAEAAQIITLITNENPQTTALLLSYLSPKKAADVLTNLPQDTQSEIIVRIANMGSVMPEYVREAERVLEQRLANLGLADQTVVGGIEAVVNIINSVDRSSEKFLLESLDAYDEELGEEVRNKLFVFEDILTLQPQAVQRVLKEIEQHDLAVALKGSTEELQKFILSNMSKRQQEIIKDEIDVLGPVRIRDVEECQQRIVGVVRLLEETGEIIVSRGEGGDVIV